jgi:hypothetical protein
MKKNVGIAKRIAVGCVVATGIAIVWGVAVSWLGMIGETLKPAEESSMDAVMVAADGTPVIRTDKYTNGVTLLVERRTLDGKLWPMTDQDFLESAYFPEPYKDPGVVELPIPWDTGNGRITGGTDGKDPPGAWYFVRGNDETGDVYVTGFDGISKLPLGFIGRNGYRASKPAAAEQFNVPKSRISEGFTYLTQSSHRLEIRSLVRPEQVFGDNKHEMSVYLLCVDQLWDIDLRQRTARPEIQFDGAMSMGQIRVNRAVFDQLPNSLPDQSTAKEKKEWQQRNENERFQYAGLTGVRQRDRLILFDLYHGKKETFLLPQQLHDRRFSAFLVGPDQMLIDAHEQRDEYWSNGPIVRLFWINRKGEIQREKEVKLAGWRPPALRSIAWGASSLVPVPIVWIVGMVLGAPLYLLQIDYIADFASSLSFVADIAWPPLTAILVVAAALTWLTLRLQRKYRRDGSTAWAAFVFVFGIPGFLAYLVEHRRAKLEACRQCGEVVPRDRDSCAACDTEFAPASRVGTEIFA